MKLMFGPLQFVHLLRDESKNFRNKSMVLRGATGPAAALALGALALGLAAMPTGCSTAPESGEGSRTLAKSSGQEPSQESLRGAWAKLSVFTSQSSALGVTARSSIGRYSLVQLAPQNDGSWSAQETLCEIKIKSSGSTSIAFPDALVRSIGTNRYNYQVSASRVQMSQAVDLLGVRLGDPVTDPLLSESSFDQDGDGNPGVSVDVSAKVLFSTLEGQLYLMQRTIWSEEGLWEGAGRIKGTLQWKVEQKTLGSTNRLLSAVTPTITTLPDESPFYLVKLPEGSDCKAVTALRGRDLPEL